MNVTIDPFQIFSLPVAYNLDLSSLRQSYLALQKKYHPDNFTHYTEQELVVILQNSSQINDAYNILISPLLRAQAIVNIKYGVQDKERIKRNDFEFLSLQMSLRERLEKIKSADDFELYQELANINKSIFAEEEAKLITCFANEDYPEAINIIDRLKYVDKFAKELDILEDKIFLAI